MLCLCDTCLHTSGWKFRCRCKYSSSKCNLIYSIFFKNEFSGKHKYPYTTFQTQTLITAAYESGSTSDWERTGSFPKPFRPPSPDTATHWGRVRSLSASELGQLCLHWLVWHFLLTRWALQSKGSTLLDVQNGRTDPDTCSDELNSHCLLSKMSDAQRARNVEES